MILFISLNFIQYSLEFFSLKISTPSLDLGIILFSILGFRIRDKSLSSWYQIISNLKTSTIEGDQSTVRNGLKFEKFDHFFLEGLRFSLILEYWRGGTAFWDEDQPCRSMAKKEEEKRFNKKGLPMVTFHSSFSWIDFFTLENFFNYRKNFIRI